MLKTSNSSNKSTTSSPLYEPSEYELLLQTPELKVFEIVLISVVIVLNIIVLIKAASNCGIKPKMSFFICHLAVVDLLTGLLVALADMLLKIYPWRGPAILCKVHRFLQCQILYASSYLLVSMSLDRALSISHPLNWNKHETSKYWLVGAAWAFSSIFSIPHFLWANVQRNNETAECNLELPVLDSGRNFWGPYMTLTAIDIFLIPAVIITICYVVIIRVIYKSTSNTFDMPNDGRARRNGLERHRKCSETLFRSRDPKGAHVSLRSGGVLTRAKIKSIKLTFAIVLAFVLCWSIYFSFNLLHVYKVITSHPPLLTIFIQTLAPLNSAVNPIIYLVFNWKTDSPSTERKQKMNIKMSRNTQKQQNNSHTYSIGLMTKDSSPQSQELLRRTGN